MTYIGGRSLHRRGRNSLGRNARVWNRDDGVWKGKGIHSLGPDVVSEILTSTPASVSRSPLALNLQALKGTAYVVGQAVVNSGHKAHKGDQGFHFADSNLQPHTHTRTHSHRYSEIQIRIKFIVALCNTYKSKQGNNMYLFKENNKRRTLYTVMFPMSATV